MTASRVVTIWCDGKLPDGNDCPHWEDDGGMHKATGLRQQLRRSGWIRLNGKDYCPECASADFSKHGRGVS